MSEFALIKKYFQSISSLNPNTILGIGDDCAISQFPENSQLVSCVDTLVAGRHFPLHTPAHAIAWKSVAVNLSDLAAMGATPYAILLALSLPEANEQWLKDFSQGLQDICQKYHIQLIGGDTTKNPTLTISITALGFIPNNQAITRSGAKIGDIICVSGEIGNASLALIDALKQKISPVHNALDYPQPQVKLGEKLRNYASAMVDISDGLAQDLNHILVASNVGATLLLEKIPTSETLKQSPISEIWHHQLNGGDDYELCFTISYDRLNQFQKKYPDIPIYPIGQITEDNKITFKYNDQNINFNIKGWEHF